MKKIKYRKTPKLNHSTISRDYYKELKKFTFEVLKSFEYFTMQAFKKDIPTLDANRASSIKFTLSELLKRWDKEAKERSKKMASRHAKRVSSYVNGKFKIQMGISFKNKSEKLKMIEKARYYENISLIRSIPQGIFERYESTFYNAITSGDQNEILRKLMHVKNITARQALTIARDQTSKMIEGVNMSRQQELGIEYYEWSTSDDERVSDGYGGHNKLNGKIFRYDRPEAIIDSYGNVGNPSERVNCRCVAIGIILEPGQYIVKVSHGYEVRGEINYN